MIDEVLPYPPIETLVKVNHSLEVDNFLVHYNSQHKEHLDSNPVLELFELSETSKDQTILSSEKAFMEKLASHKPNSPAKDLLDNIEELFTSLKQNEPSDHSPSPTQAKVRRTAAILYKSALIPNQEYNSGRTKAVFGPYGVNPKNVRDTTQEILDNLNCPVWKWTGEMPKSTEENNKTQEKTQYVRVSPKELDLHPFHKVKDSEYFQAIHEELSAEKTLQRHNEISEEHTLIEKLSKRLEHPTYLPKTNPDLSHHKSGVYMEYYPEKIDSGNFKERIQCVNNIRKALGELWHKGGVIFTDIKTANFKKRSDGLPVLVDLGSKTIIDSSMGPAIFLSSLSPESTGAFAHPEVINSKKDSDPKINIESYLAFQIGILLIETFFPDEYREELTFGIGNKWQYTNQDKTVDMVSINSSTFTALNNKYPGRITNQLADLLVKLLDNNPVYRPPLRVIGQVLENIAEQENLPVLPPSISEQNKSYSTNKQSSNGI